MFRIVMRICLLASVGVLLAGCAAAVEPQPAVPPQPVEVYSDGVYSVEVLSTRVTEAGEGQQCAVISLRVTNGSLEDLVLSSVLCFAISENSPGCGLTAPPEDCTPLDGLIRPGTSAEGCLAVLMPSGTNELQIKLAVDYLDDQWVGFGVNVG